MGDINKRRINMREHKNEDYKLMLQNKMHEFKYYIRDVFTYKEVQDMLMFCDEIMRDKEDGGYDNDNI